MNYKPRVGDILTIANAERIKGDWLSLDKKYKITSVSESMFSINNDNNQELDYRINCLESSSPYYTFCNIRTERMKKIREIL